MLYYLEAIDEILQNRKLARNLSSSSSTPATSPFFNTILNSSSNTPAQLGLGSSVEMKISLPSELDKKSAEEALVYLLNQVAESAKTIQKCADHQKCMTDDVLQLSRLRSNKLVINDTFYRPYDTVNTAVIIFKPQVETKVPPHTTYFSSLSLFFWRLNLFVCRSSPSKSILKKTTRTSRFWAIQCESIRFCRTSYPMLSNSLITVASRSSYPSPIRLP